MSIDLIVGESIKLTITKGAKKFDIVIKDAKTDKIISLLDTYKAPWTSAFVRARIRTEILKFRSYRSEESLDRDIMKAILENLDKLKEL